MRASARRFSRVGKFKKGGGRRERRNKRPEKVEQSVGGEGGERGGETSTSGGNEKADNGR